MKRVIFLNFIEKFISLSKYFCIKLSKENFFFLFSSSFSFFLSPFLIKRKARNGVRKNATIKEHVVAIAMVIGSEFINSPVSPVKRKIKGKNAAIIVRAEEIMGMENSEAAFHAASNLFIPASSFDI